MDRAGQGETEQICALWRRSQRRGERVCLATVVHVQGSSYRKPGARMLVSSGGERAGTISGGCLEAEVSRKAWWLTAQGAALECYQSSFDEDGGGVPWGLGCGGTVWVLLEQNPEAVLEALERSIEVGDCAVMVAELQPRPRTLAVMTGAGSKSHSGSYLNGTALPMTLQRAAATAESERRSLKLDAQLAETLRDDEELPAFFVEYLPAPPRLTIFGAGDDAQPIARFARALGWRVAVADGRINLLRRERFPEVVELRQLRYANTGDSPVSCGLGAVAEAEAGNSSQPDAFGRAGADAAREQASSNGVLVETGVLPDEMAVVLTHSYEQDRALLAALLPKQLPYLGILGPRHRTQRLLEEIAPALGWSVERCLRQLHAPVGLDLGARDPAAIALSIVAELQATLAGRQVEVLRLDVLAPVPGD